MPDNIEVNYKYGIKGSIFNQGVFTPLISTLDLLYFEEIIAKIEADMKKQEKDSAYDKQQTN